MSRYYKIIDAVCENFATYIGYAKTEFPDGGGWTLTKAGENQIEVFTLRREVELNGAPNRVCFWQTSADILPPDMVGGGLIDIPPAPKYRANIRRVRSLNITTELWGIDEDTTENYLHAMILAWDQATHNAVEFGSETWIDQEEGSDSWDRVGRIVRFDVSVKIPVYDLPNVLTTVTAIEHDCDLDL